MKVQANGIEIGVDIIGDGVPLLMIMGIGAQLLHWPEGFVRQLADAGFQCIRFDNRDMGLSQRMTGDVDVPGLIARRLIGRSVNSPYTLSDMARDSVGVLDALDIESAHVIGASMGGMIAQRIAIETPERMRTLTALMTSAGRRRDALVSLRAVRALLRSPVIHNADDYADSVVEFLDAVGSPGVERDLDELRRVCHLIYERGLNPAGFNRQLAAIIADGDRRAELADIDVPTLVLHGLSDPLLSPAGGRALADAIPGARFEGIDGMGHDLPRNAWRTLTDHIVDHVVQSGDVLAERRIRA